MQVFFFQTQFQIAHRDLSLMLGGPYTARIGSYLAPPEHKQSNARALLAYRVAMLHALALDETEK